MMDISFCLRNINIHLKVYRKPQPAHLYGVSVMSPIYCTIQLDISNISLYKMDSSVANRRISWYRSPQARLMP